MTPEQHYLFDVTGYLHLQNVLSERELQDAQGAAERYVQTPYEERPPGFKGDNPEKYIYGFAFDKALEALALHPITWPIIKELTSDKPRLYNGTLAVNTHKHDYFGVWHCAREGYGWQSTRYEVRDNRIYCDMFIAFVYLTDVLPGDGGLVVIPGSHKAGFERPANLFVPVDDKSDPEPHPAFTNITPRAGDVVFISELLTHGILHWKPEDRDRRFLILRYQPQYAGQGTFPQEILDRLSPETRELTEPAFYKHVKEIVKKDQITLTPQEEATP